MDAPRITDSCPICKTDRYAKFNRYYQLAKLMISVNSYHPKIIKVIAWWIVGVLAVVVLLVVLIIRSKINDADDY